MNARLVFPRLLLQEIVYRNGCIQFINCRYSVTTVKSPSLKKIKPAPPTKHETCDWIGPADSQSNIRKVKFYIPENESPAEREFRIMRQDVQNWNHIYWKDHNTRFLDGKEAFIKGKLEHLGHFNDDGTKRALTQEELAEYYRTFLNGNFKKHLDYNWMWYNKNFSLLLPAIRVLIQRTFKKFTKR